MPTLYAAAGAPVGAADTAPVGAAALGPAAFSEGGLVLVDELWHAPASSDSAMARPARRRVAGRGTEGAAGDFGGRGVTKAS